MYISFYYGAMETASTGKQQEKLKQNNKNSSRPGFAFIKFIYGC
jgi:hypothetical protein